VSINNLDNFDEKWMRAALEWSWRGKGWTSPRPSVGCVLVRDGGIIGAGHTQKGNGNPHGEVMALRDAWKRDPMRGPRGATAYVTLEPCSHFGTTPPCCDALVREGIVRVVAGVLDPDPRVAGRGFNNLRRMGIEVEQTNLQKECFAAMDEFLFHIVQKRPFVTLKLASSLDGKIALPSGESQWISGIKSREHTHLLRHYSDAVLTGIGTVLNDDPTLSVRLEGRYKQPKRIVMDSLARLPLDAKIWENAPELIVAVSSEAPTTRVQALLKQGATVLEIGANSSGQLNWDELLALLYEREIISILVEGGPTVAGSALKAGIVNKVAQFVAPKIIGAGKSSITGFEVQTLAETPELQLVSHQNFENDILFEGYLAPLPLLFIEEAAN
jgi:diaminohydroxyphosphoribosylaminopyrimidine deaminase/5-amino-6-(5-phosphoribosylamino)uracil reductase